MWYVVIGLSLAIGIGYLVKYSSILRSILGLPEDSDHATLITPLGNAGGEKIETANAATQTSIETDAPSASPPFNLSTDALKPFSASAAADSRCSPQTEQPGFSNSRTAAIERKAAIATEATRVLQKQVDKMVEEAERHKQLIAKMEADNSQLRDRLADQAKVQLTRGPSKFEDICLGENRPSQLIKRYADLYTDDRIDACDDLDLLPQVIDDDNKQKLLFSIVVLCFRQAKSSLERRQRSVRTILLSSSDGSDTGVLNDQADRVQLNALIRSIDDCVESCLRGTVSRYDIAEDFKEVTSQLWSKLVDYPSLRNCQSLLRYIEECLRIAWALTIQNPAYVIEHDADVFCDDRHTRFHTSDPDSIHIESFMWPALVERPSGFCASKAVVVTRKSI